MDISIEEMIVALVERDLRVNTDRGTLFDLFKDGCPGYTSMSDERIIELYKQDILGEE